MAAFSLLPYPRAGPVLWAVGSATATLFLGFRGCRGGSVGGWGLGRSANPTPTHTPSPLLRS